MQNFYGKMYIVTGFLAVSTSSVGMEPNPKPVKSKSFNAPTPGTTSAEEQEAAIIAYAKNELNKAYKQLEEAERAYRQKRLMNTEPKSEETCHII